VSAAGISPDLFEAARLGDPQAIASLLETAQPNIRRYARATCRSSADAEDATQEALWILFRHVGTIRSWLAFSAWLFSVVGDRRRRGGGAAAVAS
jgi:DNA-directed RNA polymerase specialized sigma24 family protein